MIEFIANSIFNIVRAIGYIAILTLMLGTFTYWAVVTVDAIKKKVQKKYNH